MDKVLLKGSSIAEREEENRRYRESHHQIHQKLKQNFVSGKKDTKKSPVSFPQKNVNKEISITFEQMAIHRCVRSQIGGIFGCN